MAPKPKLTPEQQEEIRALKRENPNLPNADIAVRFAIHRDLVAKILATTPQQPEAATTLRAIPHADIVPDPDQPRKTFDIHELDELARSIEGRGLLQNLVVRMGSEPDRYILVAGERRWRAIGMLIERGSWVATIPCLVRTGNAAQLAADSLIENLQRVDLPVLEEAEAFAKLHELDPQTWSTAHIAERIGKTPRFVQQRIALARNLHPYSRQLLTHGKITLESARKLAALDPNLQNRAIVDMLDAYCIEFSNEKAESGNLNWAELPTFDADDVDGNIDYIKRQAEAEQAHTTAQARAKEDASAAGEETEYEQAPQGEDGGHLADACSPAAGERHEAPAAAGISTEPSGPPVTKTHIYHAHRRKSIAMQHAIAADHLMAMRLTCLALLTHQRAVFLQTDNPLLDDKVSELPALDAQISAIAGKKLDPYPSDRQRVKLWAHLAALPDGKLQTLFATLIARQTITGAEYNCELGDHPLPLAIATSLGLTGHEAEHGLTLTQEDLAGLRKPALLALAGEVSAPGVNDQTKTADLIAAIAATRTNYVLPTCRFGTTAQIEKALKGLSHAG